MDLRDLIRLQHMLSSCEAIRSFIQDKAQVDLDNDRLLNSAIIRELEILGEASVAISNETKEKFPDLPWRQMIDMRNRLIHAYFNIDNEIIWNTITQRLPPLTEQLKSLIANHTDK